MKKIFITTLLFTASLAVSAAQTIRFGMEASYPPFESINDKNEIVGFDIDLANALCKQINATCTFKHQSFDGLIPSLKFKRIDAVISGMDITPDREKEVLFSQPYYDNSASFVVLKGQYSELAHLKGKKVGVQNGTTHQKFILDKHSEITLVPYDSYQNAKLDLQNGRVDAVFGDTAVLDEWLKVDAKLATLRIKITDKNYFGIGLGIAVRKGNTKLQEQFNKALAEIKKNGTFETIYQNWFGR